MLSQRNQTCPLVYRYDFSASRAHPSLFILQTTWNKCSPYPSALFDVTQNPCCVFELVRLCTNQCVQPHQTVCTKLVRQKTPCIYIFVSSVMRTKILVSSWKNNELAWASSLNLMYHPCIATFRCNLPLHPPQQDKPIDKRENIAPKLIFRHRSCALCTPCMPLSSLL